MNSLLLLFLLILLLFLILLLLLLILLLLLLFIITVVIVIVIINALFLLFNILMSAGQVNLSRGQQGNTPDLQVVSVISVNQPPGMKIGQMCLL